MKLATGCLLTILALAPSGQTLAQEAQENGSPEPNTDTRPASPPAVADPTAPSAKIRQRMAAQRTPTVANPTEPSVSPTANPTMVTPPVAVAPTIRLKAIVLVDQDHGAAILECMEDRFSIALERQPTSNRSSQATESSAAAAFTVMNWTFTVADFTDRAVLLKSQDGSYSMWVQ